MGTQTRTPGSKQPAMSLYGYEYPQRAVVMDRANIGNFNSVTPWTILNDATDNLAVAPEHVLGTQSLEFDKIDGTGHTECGAYCTIASLDLRRFSAVDEMLSCIHISDVTNVAYAFVRLGTAAGHCNEWRIDDSILVGATLWNDNHLPLGECVVAGVGNGWNPAAVVYMAVGVEFDLEAQALIEIKFDHVTFVASVGHW